MLIPECPPSKPSTRISKSLDCFCDDSRLRGNVISVSPPPAQPTYKSPHSSVSRLSIVRPVNPNASASKSMAPVKPVSSSTVKSASIGGRGLSHASGPSSGMESNARAAATPMPLSAPSVVPYAPIQFPFASSM